MNNPWTKKNPFLSLWLSGANAATGRARSAAAAEIGRRQTALAKQSVKFWTDAWRSALTPKRRP